MRHGQTEWNLTGRIQGFSDIGLDETGRAQAAAAAPALAEYEPARIIASDLRRAVDTARPIAERTGLEIELDKRLRERGYGPWEGLTMREIAERFPEDHARWRSQEPLLNPEIETWGGRKRPTGEAARDRLDCAARKLYCLLDGRRLHVVNEAAPALQDEALEQAVATFVARGAVPARSEPAHRRRHAA